MSDAEDDPNGVVVEQESLHLLARHARISIAFLVDRALEVSLPDERGLEGIRLSDVPVERPWVTDYDAGEGSGPLEWPKRFDLTHWGLLGAYENHERVAGAVIAYRTPEINMLEGRNDLAVLWDLRVAPAARGHGVGSALFRAVEQWARDRGCRELKVETQNVNIGACRFYARMGCVLGAINSRAYPELPDEAQLLWYRALSEVRIDPAPQTSAHDGLKQRARTLPILQCSLSSQESAGPGDRLATTPASRGSPSSRCLNKRDLETFRVLTV